MQGHHKNSRYHLKDMVTNPAVMFLKCFVSIQKRKKLTFIGPSGFVISEHSRNSLHRKRKHSISHPGPETPYYLLLLHQMDTSVQKPVSYPLYLLHQHPLCIILKRLEVQLFLTTCNVISYSIFPFTCYQF